MYQCFMRLKSLYFNEDKNRNVSSLKTQNCFVLFYCIDGTGTLKINKKNHSFKPNSYFIMSPLTSVTKISEFSKTITIEFEYDGCLGKIIDGAFSDDNNTILYIIKKLRSTQFKHREFKTELLLTYQNLLILKILEKIENTNISPNKPIDKEINDIVNYLKNNFHQNIDFEKLFNSYGYSYTHLRRLFKKHIGCPPHKFLMEIRLDESKKLLSESALSINIIAEKCGFSNTKHFSTFFYNQTGMTPKEYRSQKGCS